MLLHYSYRPSQKSPFLVSAKYDQKVCYLHVMLGSLDSYTLNADTPLELRKWKYRLHLIFIHVGGYLWPHLISGVKLMLMLL
jgi:hypothetical protein